LPAGDRTVSAARLGLVTPQQGDREFVLADASGRSRTSTILNAITVSSVEGRAAAAVAANPYRGGVERGRDIVLCTIRRGMSDQCFPGSEIRGFDGKSLIEPEQAKFLICDR
jgi:hypothetical protein